MTWVASETTVFADRTRAQVVASTDVGNASTADKVKRAQLIAAVNDLLDLAIQYRNDLRHPVSPDSLDRRIAAIDAAIAKATGK